MQVNKIFRGVHWLTLNPRIGMMFYGLIISLGFIIPFAAGYVATDHDALSAILIFSSFAYVLLLATLWDWLACIALIPSQQRWYEAIWHLYVVLAMVFAFFLGSIIRKTGLNFDFDTTIGVLISASGFIKALMFWRVVQNNRDGVSPRLPNE
jgi:glucan phosphoethanolaminetransferase (alkaline phosphatase superfamily)